MKLSQRIKKEVEWFRDRPETLHVSVTLSEAAVKELEQEGYNVKDQEHEGTEFSTLWGLCIHKQKDPEGPDVEVHGLDFYDEQEPSYYYSVKLRFKKRK